jgi:hypothetical protein
MERESAFDTRPRCGRRFRVLADESGGHDCPSCGHRPEDEEEAEWQDRFIENDCEE